MTYLLRLVLPDRPGSLGAVATALGATGVDIESLDVIERGPDGAVDDLVVGSAGQRARRRADLRRAVGPGSSRRIAAAAPASRRDGAGSRHRRLPGEPAGSGAAAARDARSGSLPGAVGDGAGGDPVRAAAGHRRQCECPARTGIRDAMDAAGRRAPLRRGARNGFPRPGPTAASNWLPHRSTGLIKRCSSPGPGDRHFAPAS